MHFKKGFFKLILLVLLLIARSDLIIAQPRQLIDLQCESVIITPKEFFIARITDERKDKTCMGVMLIASTQPGKAPVFEPVDLKDGSKSLAAYVNGSLWVNKTLRPVVFELKELVVKETDLGGGRVSGQINLKVSFALQKGEETVHLVDYAGSASYQRKAGTYRQIEPLLRSTINKSLVYINNWMDSQAGNNIKLASRVKLIFTNYYDAEEGDTVYYAVDRPLKWTDFKDKPPLNSKYGAEIYASLGYNEDVKLKNGVINITLAIKVYAPKSACWVKYNSPDAYGLNHEQRHFDIVKLVAEHFKQRIIRENLNVDNYDGSINVAYFDALRELNEMQKQYDLDTHHSINSWQQQQWDNKIDKELVSLGVKTKGV